MPPAGFPASPVRPTFEPPFKPPSAGLPGDPRAPARWRPIFLVQFCPCGFTPARPKLFRSSVERLPVVWGVPVNYDVTREQNPARFAWIVRVFGGHLPRIRPGERGTDRRPLCSRTRPSTEPFGSNRSNRNDGTGAAPLARAVPTGTMYAVLWDGDGSEGLTRSRWWTLGGRPGRSVPKPDEGAVGRYFLPSGGPPCGSCVGRTAGRPENAPSAIDRPVGQERITDLPLGPVAGAAGVLPNSRGPLGTPVGPLAETWHPAAVWPFHPATTTASAGGRLRPASLGVSKPVQDDPCPSPPGRRAASGSRSVFGWPGMDDGHRRSVRRWWVDGPAAVSRVDGHVSRGP